MSRISYQVHTTMFVLDTYIHISGHVLIVFHVEYLPACWNSMHATSLIVPMFMRFHLSWFDSIVYQISSAITDILIHYISSSTLEILTYCILYVVMTTHVTFCISCLFMAIVLLCIQDCYMYLQSYAKIDYCTILMDGWFFYLVLHHSTSRIDFIMYLSHHVTPLTSHFRGHLLQLILPHMVDHIFMAFPITL